MHNYSNYYIGLVTRSLTYCHVFSPPEPLIGKVYVEQIIERLRATLSEAKGMSDAGNMEPLVSFISDVAFNFFSSLKGCLLLAAAVELLLTIFQLCAQDQMLTHLSGNSLNSVVYFSC